MIAIGIKNIMGKRIESIQIQKVLMKKISQIPI
jgi:hypothetical protein